MTAVTRSGVPAGVRADGRTVPAGVRADGRTVPAGVRADGRTVPAAGGRARLRGLDGVRGLAVLAVMAFHEGLPWIPGGFLGVDVFFVLSGYLITDLLVAQFDRRGRLDLRGFWARRARRLLPALAVVLVAVTAAVTVFQPDQLSGLRRALLCAATFSSNWSQAVAHLASPPAGLTLQQQIAEGQKISAATQVAAAAARTGQTAPRASRPATGHDTVPAPTAAQPAVTGSMVTAVGDSVMLASAQALQAVLPGIYINAVVSRQMPQGVQLVRRLAASGQLRPVLLLGLGTNGNMSTGEINRVRAAIGPRRWLVLINTYEPRPWEEPVNAMIDAAARHDPHVLLADWHGAIGHHTNMLRDDDVHPQPPGAVLYAQLIRSAVEQAR